MEGLGGEATWEAVPEDVFAWNALLRIHFSWEVPGMKLHRRHCLGTYSQGRRRWGSMPPGRSWGHMGSIAWEWSHMGGSALG